MSLKLEEIESALLTVELDAKKRAEILKAAEEIENEKKEDRAANPKTKSKYKLTVLVRGDKELAEKVQQAWVVKTLEEQDDNTLIERIGRATGIHNANQKRKKNFIETFADFFEFCKRSVTKQEEVAVQTVTKTPVRVVVLENERIDGQKVVE